MTSSVSSAPQPALRTRTRTRTAPLRDPRVVLAALMVLAAALMLYAGRGTTFFFDDWDYVQAKYGGGLHSLLVPHNDHLSLIPIAIYKVLFHVVGLSHYGVFRGLLVALNLLCAALVYALVSRRLGQWAGVVAAAALLFMGASWQNMIWPFQMDYMLSTAAGLVAWILLDRDDRAGDFGALVATAVALASSGLGIPVTIAVAVELAWRREWRRIWVAVLPGALYLVWYLKYGTNSLHSASEVHAVSWALDAGAAATGALVGLGLDWGRPLLLALLLLTGWRLLRGAGVPARALGAAALAVSFWLLTGLSRSDVSTPDTSRYLYLGGVAVIIFAAELLRGPAPPPRALWTAAAVAAVGALIGLGSLDDGSTTLRGVSQTVKAELGALQLAAAHAPAAYRPDTQNAPQIVAGQYLHMVRSVGSSPADSPAEILAANPAARVAADRVLREIQLPALAPAPRATPSPSAPAPTVERAVAATATTRGNCVLATPVGPGATVFVTARGGLVVRDSARLPVGLWIRRFADSFYLLPAGVPPGATRALSLAADAASVPWHVEVGLPGAVQVCGLAA